MKRFLATAGLASVLVLSAPLAANAAVYMVGPGCSTTSVCMRRGDGTPIGYDGTGTLAITQSSIRSVAAGSRTTTVKLASGAIYTIAATKMITFPNALQTIKSISR
jgi:hypothetical protein